MVVIKESPYEPGCYFVGSQQWRIPPRYRLLKVLGNGSFSFVCLAEDVEKAEKVAIKFIPDVTSSAEYAKRILREVCILRRISHPGVIEMKGAFVQPSSTGPKKFIGGKLVNESIDLYVVLEYVDGGDLFSLKGQLQELDVKSLLMQLLLVVQYLHSLNVWHRDLKSANVLITYQDGARMLKVCDFGSARSKSLKHAEPQDGLTPGELRKRRRLHHTGSMSGSESGSLADLQIQGGADGMQSPLTRTVATPCYRAPEVIMSRGVYTAAIDMWSIGCIFAELLQRTRHTGGNFTPFLQVAPLFAVTWNVPLTPAPGAKFSDASPGNAATRAELDALFNVVGTPAWACIEQVPSEQWRSYLQNLPGRAPKLFRRFAAAGEVALDLLARLLAFEPARRASPLEALCHEYLGDITESDDQEMIERMAMLRHPSQLSLGPSLAMDICGQRTNDIPKASSAPDEHMASHLKEMAVSTSERTPSAEGEFSAPGPPVQPVLLHRLSSFSLTKDVPMRVVPPVNYWEEPDPASALEMLETEIEKISTVGTEKEQSQQLRLMLEAEVQAIQTQGSVEPCVQQKNRFSHKMKKLTKQISMTDIVNYGLEYDDRNNAEGCMVDIGRGRLNNCADITTVQLEAEQHLGPSRHGEWAGNSTEKRWVSTTGWGSSTLPPGMEPGSKAAAAYLQAISAQQAR